MTSMINPKITVYLFLFMILMTSWTFSVCGQESKAINHQFHVWTSINTTMRIKGRWGIMADYHLRMNDFLKSDNFNFTRVGAVYWLDNNLTLAGGYAHLWLAPSTEGWGTYSNENRLYVQLQHAPKISRHVNMVHRLRIERRRQQKIMDDVYIGEHRYTNRFRYLLSFTIPVFRDPKLPQLAMADEILMHAGKEVIYNPLDQNRIFIGIRQSLGKNLSFDAGYMAVYQQKYSGYQYDLNHTFRLFFYYVADFRKLSE